MSRAGQLLGCGNRSEADWTVDEDEAQKHASYGAVAKYEDESENGEFDLVIDFCTDLIIAPVLQTVGITT